MPSHKILCDINLIPGLQVSAIHCRKLIYVDMKKSSCDFVLFKSISSKAETKGQLSKIPVIVSACDPRK